MFSRRNKVVVRETEKNLLTQKEVYIVDAVDMGHMSFTIGAGFYCCDKFIHVDAYPLKKKLDSVLK